MRIHDLPTPSLVVDASALDHNLRTMAAARPGDQLRPHVKAHKCTALARRQLEAGHPGLTCATIREAEGLAAAGLGGDILVANEVLDARRLGALTRPGAQTQSGAPTRNGARITVAVDSPETVAAAVTGGVSEVIIDVNVGLPRCGCDVDDAAKLADEARRRGLVVRGVMGYEGHAMALADRGRREEEVAKSMTILAQAHDAVGGELISAGGTGTYDCNPVATEIQAGSYVLMDADYATLGLPFRTALTILATVVSVNGRHGWAVADCGLKALGMDHGDPSVAGHTVWFCSDEHLTFAPEGDASDLPAVGDRIRVLPAHVDPTVAYHDTLWVVDGEDVVDRWAVDLRGW